MFNAELIFRIPALRVQWQLFVYLVYIIIALDLTLNIVRSGLKTRSIELL
jgi:hypothetical protein